MKQYNSKLFTFDANKKTFTAEDSDLGGAEFDTVFGDGRQAGLQLVSERTGAVSTWGVTHETIRDGELMYITLTPTPDTAAKFSGLANHSMIIFND